MTCCKIMQIAVNSALHRPPREVPRFRFDIWRLNSPVEDFFGLLRGLPRGVATRAGNDWKLVDEIVSA